MTYQRKLIINEELQNDVENTAKSKFVVIKVQSAGFNSKNFARISLNEEKLELERNEEYHFRGLHVVIINPLTGKVE